MFGGTSLFTTELAAITALSPILQGPKIIEPLPIQTPSPTTISLPLSGMSVCLSFPVAL